VLSRLRTPACSHRPRQRRESTEVDAVSFAGVNERMRWGTLSGWLERRSAPAMDANELFVDRICVAEYWSLEKISMAPPKFWGLIFLYRMTPAGAHLHQLDRGESWQPRQLARVSLVRLHILSSSSVDRNMFSLQ
jgi:hypothetical protein